MKSLNIKLYIYILVTVSGIAWLIVAAMNGFNLKHFIDIIRPIPTVVTVDLIFIYIFRKWIWKWGLLHSWLVPFPNLNGTWHGYIQSDWKDRKGEKIPAILTINQTFGRISCIMITKDMISNSYAEGFNIDKEAQVCQLSYSYTSKPKATLRRESAIHDGTAILRISVNSSRNLKGEYWTQRHTIGIIELTFREKKRLDSFPQDL